MKQAIQQIRSFQEIKFDDLLQKSLVIFDIDETLITPVDLLLKPVGGNFKGWKRINPEQLEYFLSIMLANAKYVLVDEIIPILIATLNRQGVSTMGLTACSTGRIGVIPAMTMWRSDQLRALGIDFSPCFTEEYTFLELVGPASSPPIFKNGILFTGDLQHPEKSSKGQLLGIFLDRIIWKPKQIIFIDDNIKHLEAVQEVLNQKGIQFQGYLIEKPNPLLNEKIAEFQIQTLLDSNIWISDEQAAHLIKK